MKKAVSFLLVVCMLTLIGCRQEEQQPELYFYYPRQAYTQNSSDSVIAQENRENVGYLTTVDLLNDYLKGPADPNLRNPFPADLQIVDVYVINGTVIITVTDDLSLLTGTDLIIACAALGNTAIRATGIRAARVCCQSAKLDGENYIQIDDSTVRYLDTVPPETTVFPKE